MEIYWGLTHRSTVKLLLCVLSVMVNLGGYQIKCCLQNERDGLLLIKSYFSEISDTEYVSDPFASWGENRNCCEWERVECSPSTGHVIHLFLNKTVSAHEAWPLDLTVFRPFQELRTLDLSSNRIGSMNQIEGITMLSYLQDLDLRSNEIAYVPDFLWNFSSLRVLDLSRGQLTGKLAGPLCRLRNIRELYFSNNQLDGNLPPCLWNLTSLQVLDLSGNNFSGNLPTQINLPSLEWLSIESNHFQGKFSFSSLANHSNLTVVMFSNNTLQVEIEESLSLSTMQLQILGLASCHLGIHSKILEKFLLFQSNLQYIDLSYNSLVGSFPTWLLRNNSDLKLLNLGTNSLSGVLELPQHINLSLVSLDISNNLFYGEIPRHIGMVFSTLELLQMSNNSFYGLIPSSLSNMTQLEILDLSKNELSGKVPDRVFSYCSHLVFLVLSSNSLSGEIIPSNMNLSSLSVLSLENNLFTGTIKDSLKTSILLEYLDISNNTVIGELPSWIGGLSLLRLLSLARNQFHGNIPSHAFSFEFLQFLDLSENRFTGELPKEITQFSNLTILLLRDNLLQGELPIQLCQLQHLNYVDLSINSLSGAIPSCLQNLSFRAIEKGYFDVAEYIAVLEPSFSLFKLKSHYIFRGHVERDGFKFKGGNKYQIISFLDLSINLLTGEIPPEFGSLTRLYGIDLSYNQLCGSIPESFSKLESIELLDLSYNKLSGKIPSQLVDLYFLEAFNVSYNNLSGEVPEGNQFDTFLVTSYLGNPLLCGWLMPKQCSIKEAPSSSSTESRHPKSRTVKERPCSPSTELRDEEDSAFDWKVFFWSFGMSALMVLFTFVLVMYIKSDWRRAWFALSELYLRKWLYY